MVSNGIHRVLTHLGTAYSHESQISSWLSWRRYHNHLTCIQRLLLEFCTNWR